MLTRLAYFLVLIAYVNTAFYQGGQVLNEPQPESIFDGAPLVEVILETVLDIPSTGEETTPGDVQYDEYRPATTKYFPTPLPKTIATIDFVPDFVAYKRTLHAYFDSKISCFLGYYIFLFRLKPF